MKKITFFLLWMVALSFSLQAAQAKGQKKPATKKEEGKKAKKQEKEEPPYVYEETFAISLPQNFTRWKVDFQKADKKGFASKRYIPENENSPNWTQLVNIQFRAKPLIKAKTAKEAMKEEAALSKRVSFKVISEEDDNDLIYERKYPSGEYEIVRMILTKRGLHRAAYVKRGYLPEGEKNEWVERLSNGYIKEIDED